MSENQPPEEVIAEIDPETGFVIEPQASVQRAEGSAGQPAAASLDQVREILLGSHTRTVEQRLALIENRLDEAVSELTQQMTSRIDGLDGFIKNELTMLLEKLGTQREERSELFKRMQADVDSGTKRLDERIDELSAGVEKGQDDLRETLLCQVNAITEQIERRSGELTRDLASRTAQLRTEMVDRASLSSVLSEAALQMSNAAELPVPDPARTVADTLDEALDAES